MRTRTRGKDSSGPPLRSLETAAVAKQWLCELRLLVVTAVTGHPLVHVGPHFP